MAEDGVKGGDDYETRAHETLERDFQEVNTHTKIQLPQSCCGGGIWLRHRA